MWNGVSAVMTKSTTKLVCDAGPIIHLDELSCLDLLADFQEIILSNIVCEEIKMYRPLALKRQNLSFTTLSRKIPPDETIQTICRIFSLDAGETEALALMQKNPQAIFLTDDAAARLVAEQMRFKVHGTIGIIIRSVRRGQKKPEEVVKILSNLPIKSTLYIEASLLKEIIIKIKNEFDL